MRLAVGLIPTDVSIFSGVSISCGLLEFCKGMEYFKFVWIGLFNKYNLVLTGDI